MLEIVVQSRPIKLPKDRNVRNDLKYFFVQSPFLENHQKSPKRRNDIWVSTVLKKFSVKNISVKNVGIL